MAAASVSDHHKRMKQWLTKVNLSVFDKNALLDILKEEYQIDMKKASNEVNSSNDDCSEQITKQFNEVRGLVVESLVCQQTLQEKLNREHIQDSQEHATLIEMMRRICYALNIAIPTVVKLNPLGYRKRKATGPPLEDENGPIAIEDCPDVVPSQHNDTVSSTEPTQVEVPDSPPAQVDEGSQSEEVVTFPVSTIQGFKYIEGQITSSTIFRDSLLKYLKGLLSNNKPESTLIGTILSSLITDDFVHAYHPQSSFDKTALFKTQFILLMIKAWSTPQYNPTLAISRYIDGAWSRHDVLMKASLDKQNL